MTPAASRRAVRLLQTLDTFRRARHRGRIHDKLSSDNNSVQSNGPAKNRVGGAQNAEGSRVAACSFHRAREKQKAVVVIFCLVEMQGAKLVLNVRSKSIRGGGGETGFGSTLDGGRKTAVQEGRV
jgi:hypothetical protein